MNLFFELNDTSAVIKAIDQVLSGRKLGDIVKLSQSGNDLVVTFSKFGTSTLLFSSAPKNKGLEFKLSSEKIAFTHRALKDEVKEKLCRAVEQAGGKIIG